MEYGKIENEILNKICEFESQNFDSVVIRIDLSEDILEEFSRELQNPIYPGQKFMGREINIVPGTKIIEVG